MLGLMAFLAVTGAVCGAFSSFGDVRPSGGAIAIEAIPVPLDPTRPSRDRLGPLVYLGGLWLRAHDRERRFGGLSDLRVTPDGLKAFVVSDCGEGVTMRLSYDAAGRLVGAGDAQVIPLEVGPLGGLDSESLVMGEDTLEVGFEGRPKILAYRKDPPFGGPPRALPVPAGVARCESNSGLETMADVGEGRRLLVCEGRRFPSITVPAWIGSRGSWTEREYPMVFEGGWGGEPFRPTAAALLPGGDVKVTGIVPEHSGVVLEKLREAGLDVEVGSDWARVRRHGSFRGLRVKTAPFPGFPTDMQAQIMALLTQADGVSAISENIFENRFMHVPELARLGADIEIEGKTAVVNGPSRLSGAPVMATDLRASASLVLAGLAATGETRVRRVYHIDRGYERIEEKLAQLGGRIRREAE